MSRLKDVDSILDHILSEARKFARADAGSIFLVEGDHLQFSYVQNDTLFTADSPVKDVYYDFTVPISRGSIVGYTALTGRTVVIDDAYAMDSGLPYAFNPSYDMETGYRTGSIMAIPITSYMDRVLGVMQIINAKDENGATIPFSSSAQEHLPLLAGNASVALERGLMNREAVLRMIRMAQLHDPSETGAHVRRVGAYCAEIYHQWALNRGVGIRDIKKNKDHIRYASMLHDVGKVGISDLILKKPGKLDDAEFTTVKMHTVFGGKLFESTASELDVMCLEIALNHHERWDGGGYPGKVPNIFAPDATFGTPKQGEEIPLPARITSLADVYDALVSKRVYKEGWPEEEVLAYIREQSGRQFDPQVVEAFFQVLDVIQIIRERYKDAPHPATP
ncbi:MAG: HD domain-containing phosphohydrolase [Desulfovibrionaceae bacterium]